MARKPRIHYSGACYHVILRGNAKQDIFHGDEDRLRFYLLMQEGTERYGHRIHAFCLMTNHVHLLVQVANVPLPRIMQNLTFRYTRWANWQQGKSGHLFQGRYKAILVDADAYLLELVRYLHLNPVRAEIAADPITYPWSSHRAYSGQETIPWLCTDTVLSNFAKRAETARKKFEAFVEDGLKEGHRPEFHGHGGADSRLLGDDAFVESVLNSNDEEPPRKISIETLAAAVCRYYGAAKEELKDGTRRAAHLRAMASWLVLDAEGCTLSALAGLTGRDISSLSSAVQRLRAKAMTDVRIIEERRAIMAIAKLQA